MKNSLGEKAVKRIAAMLVKSQPSFEQQAFESAALTKLDTLELKERVAHIIAAMHNFLPDNFPATAAILIKCKDNWIAGDEGDSYQVFAAWPIIDYIAVYGIEHPELSLETLKTLTSLFSAEFAVRPFILKYPELCLKTFELWTNDNDEHVRRLVSEGTRPRLPWGLQLKPFIVEPSPCLPLLNALKADSSLYVRRSVANHLNDIAKDHPALVLSTCKDWQKSNGQNTDVAWVIKHATRTLVKAGHPASFALLGFTNKPKISLQKLSLSTQKIAIGENISFNLALENKQDIAQSFVVDYAIHFVKANGQQSAKVFKLKNCHLAPNQGIALKKNHSFKIISTRKYYPGEHKIEMLINGVAAGEQSFLLTSA